MKYNTIIANNNVLAMAGEIKRFDDNELGQNDIPMFYGVSYGTKIVEMNSDFGTIKNNKELVQCVVKYFEKFESGQADWGEGDDRNVIYGGTMTTSLKLLLGKEAKDESTLKQLIKEAQDKYYDKKESK